LLFISNYLSIFYAANRGFCIITEWASTNVECYKMIRGGDFSMYLFLVVAKERIHSKLRS